MKKFRNIASFLVIFLCIKISVSDGISGRIVGGSDARPGEFPFFAQWGGCGASLIWEDILLTAAHCNVIESNLTLIGAYISGTIQSDSELRTIVERRRHEGWNTETFENDLLVLKLSVPSSHPVVVINNNETVPDGYENLTVIGLGSTDPRAGGFNSTGSGVPISSGKENSNVTNRQSGDILQHAEIQAIPGDVCNGEDMFNGFIQENVMLCAGVVGGG